MSADVVVRPVEPREYEAVGDVTVAAYMTVEGFSPGERYQVELTLKSGRRVPLPALRLDPATASGGQALPVDLRDVATVRVVGDEPRDVLVATLPHVEG